MPATQIRTPEVDIDKVHVVKGFNARQNFDPAELEQLAATIRASGIVQPLRVKQRDDGEFDLVAGERRFRAAKLAGLTTVPVSLSTGNAQAEAFIENHHRADLNPIEVALGLKAVAEEFGLTTNAKIAAHQKIGKSQKAGEKWVGAHLRLLDLPDEVQDYIAAGHVPLTAEPKLREIAKVSPVVAALICEVAKKNEVAGGAFNGRFADLVAAAAEVAPKHKVTMVRAAGFQLSEVVRDKKKRKSLADRINPLIHEYQRCEDPVLQLTESEVDAARAAGCLVEYLTDRYGRHYAYVTDRAFAEDLVERHVDAEEKRVAAAVKAAEDEKAKRREARKDQKKLGEESAQAKAKKRKVIARRFNDSLKCAFLKKRTPARRKRLALARSKAIALQLVSDNPRLAAAGLRLVSDQLQEIGMTQLKNGSTQEKVTYAKQDECTAELLRRVMATKDPLEVIEVLAEALLADRDEYPSKDHIGWWSPVAVELEKLMKTEIKEVRPRRVTKPY
jgi:ParB/RepB/Spo0J family partition protein